MVLQEAAGLEFRYKHLSGICAIPSLSAAGVGGPVARLINVSARYCFASRSGFVCPRVFPARRLPASSRHCRLLSCTASRRRPSRGRSNTLRPLLPLRKPDDTPQPRRLAQAGCASSACGDLLEDVPRDQLR
ncbi:uncharacterized protein LOC125940763 [Dermacentor silvarum]|uniref:uncharacterized protein LOC125940763 n=1 Tax=Dermacentor silvarum TaxID=543639 RepID=UPI0021016BA6|nr:uncharacterized protein LOC125940763 [Dermacentor silvarum]